MLQCSGETVGSGNHRTLGPDDRERQPCPVVALEARPQSGAQKGRLAGTRCAQDDQHTGDAGAHEPAELVEPAHDLRVSSEKDSDVLLFEIRKSGIGAAAWLEGEAQRVEAGVFQPFLEARIGLRIAGKIDKLLVDQIERHLAFVDPGQRNDDLLAHQPGGVDLRLAPAGRQPLGRDQREHDLAAIGGLLQGFLPALAGDDAALGVEVEENVVPAVGSEPIADLDSLVVVSARMTDEKTRHRPWPPGS